MKVKPTISKLMAFADKIRKKHEIVIQIVSHDDELGFDIVGTDDKEIVRAMLEAIYVALDSPAVKSNQLTN